MNRKSIWDMTPIERVVSRLISEGWDDSAEVVLQLQAENVELRKVKENWDELHKGTRVILPASTDHAKAMMIVAQQTLKGTST
jgi:hypothetical protein